MGIVTNPGTSAIEGYYWCPVCETKIDATAVHLHDDSARSWWHAGAHSCHRVKMYTSANPQIVVTPTCHILRRLREYEKTGPVVEKPELEDRWRNVPAKCTSCDHVIRQRVGDSFDRGERLSCKLAHDKEIDGYKEINGYVDYGELEDPPPEWCPLAV